ncbi:MAG: hypothetical protein ACE366_10715 [Bradymonadia bacterium]
MLRGLLLLYLGLGVLGCDDLGEDDPLAGGDPCMAREMVACGNTEGEINVSQGQPLAGFVGRQPWFWVQGHVQLLDTEDDPAFIAYLFDTEYVPCNNDFPMGVSHILADLPLSTGSYTLSGQRNLTFVTYDAEGQLTGNVMALSGDLIIEEITSEQVTGALYSRASDGHELNGRFSLTVCP